MLLRGLTVGFWKAHGNTCALWNMFRLACGSWGGSWQSRCISVAFVAWANPRRISKLSLCWWRYIRLQMAEGGVGGFPRIRFLAKPAHSTLRANNKTTLTVSPDEDHSSTSNKSKENKKLYYLFRPHVGQGESSSALVSRWSAWLAHAAALSFVATLFCKMYLSITIAGDLPPLGYVLSQTSTPVLPNRLSGT